MEKVDLERFLSAQEKDYQRALEEVEKGRKQSHWMWYIFPQLKGLGHSSTSEFYGIRGEKEAAAYLQHPILGQRLREICEALLELQKNDATAVMGYPDNLKLKSCMTLFSEISKENDLFDRVLEKFFNGEKDQRTIDLLKTK